MSLMLILIYTIDIASVWKKDRIDIIFIGYFEKSGSLRSF